VPPRQARARCEGALLTSTERPRARPARGPAGSSPPGFSLSTRLRHCTGTLGGSRGRPPAGWCGSRARPVKKTPRFAEASACPPFHALDHVTGVQRIHMLPSGLAMCARARLHGAGGPVPPVRFPSGLGGGPVADAVRAHGASFPRTRPGRVTADRARGPACDPGCHRAANLLLNQGLQEEPQDVQGEQRLDPPLVLEERRRDLVAGLHRLEALLDRRLALGGREPLGRAQEPVRRAGAATAGRSGGRRRARLRRASTARPSAAGCVGW
jgi:hypothetical protein